MASYYEQLYRSSIRISQDLNLLIENQAYESALILSASLWERVIMFEFLLCNPTKHLVQAEKHKNKNRAPWKVIQMVKTIAKNLHPNSAKLQNEYINLTYGEYRKLSSYKHAHPEALIKNHKQLSKEQAFIVKLQQKLAFKLEKCWEISQKLVAQ